MKRKFYHPIKRGETIYLDFARKSNEIDQAQFVFVIPETIPCETGQTEIPFEIFSTRMNFEHQPSQFFLVSHRTEREFCSSFVWSSK